MDKIHVLALCVFHLKCWTLTYSSSVWQILIKEQVMWHFEKNRFKIMWQFKHEMWHFYNFAMWHYVTYWQTSIHSLETPPPLVSMTHGHGSCYKWSFPIRTTCPMLKSWFPSLRHIDWSQSNWSVFSVWPTVVDAGITCPDHPQPSVSHHSTCMYVYVYAYVYVYICCRYFLMDYLHQKHFSRKLRSADPQPDAKFLLKCPV